MSKKHVSISHVHEPISTEPDRVAGYSRMVGDASNEVKQLVINTILEKANDYGLSNKDKANLIAFTRIESGFNPDAASRTTSASGVMQVIDDTANDAIKRLNGSQTIGGHHLGTYDRFDMNSNIDYGIAIYLDKKERVASDDAGKIYMGYNPKAKEGGKYFQCVQADSKVFEQEIARTGGLKLETVMSQPPPESYLPQHKPSTPAHTSPTVHEKRSDLHMPGPDTPFSRPEGRDERYAQASTSQPFKPDIPPPGSAWEGFVNFSRALESGDRQEMERTEKAFIGTSSVQESLDETLALHRKTQEEKEQQRQQDNPSQGFSR